MVLGIQIPLFSMCFPVLQGLECLKIGLDLSNCFVAKVLSTSLIPQR